MSSIGKVCVICGNFFLLHFIRGESNLFCPECIKRMGNLRDVLYPEKMENSDGNDGVEDEF